MKLAVPALALRVQDTLAFFEDQFLDFSWALSECDSLLNEEEFSILDHPGQAAVVDVGEKGRLEASFVADLDRQLSLLEMRGPQSEGELALWLDRQIPHPDITISESSLFLRRMVTALTKKRAYGLEHLVRHRFRLRDAAREKIDSYRKRAQLGSYESLLCSPEVCVDPRLCFEFPNQAYAANRLYSGTLRFRKHFYETPALMNKEEAECALFVDSMPEVRYWCRNVDRSPYSFWLPLPNGRFFPDFVIKLTGGQILALEYKGEAWLGTADTRAKEEVGRIWEERSDGRCFFRLVGKTDYQDVIRAVSELAARNPVEMQAGMFR